MRPSDGQDPVVERKGADPQSDVEHRERGANDPEERERLELAGRTEGEQPGGVGAPEAKEPRPGPAAAEGLVDALGHLQSAALSMVAAARAAVDAAEQLVRDPKPILDLLGESLRAGREPPSAPSSDPAGGASPVERITVRRPPPPRGDIHDGIDDGIDDDGEG